MAKTQPKKARDPLANVRVEPPRSASKPAQPEPADVATEPATEAPADPAQQAALKAEKRVVVLPPKDRPPKVKKYQVLRDQTVSWHGQMLRLKGGKTVVSDEKLGPDSIKKLQAMGVSLQEM